MLSIALVAYFQATGIEWDDPGFNYNPCQERTTPTFTPPPYPGRPGNPQNGACVGNVVDRFTTAFNWAEVNFGNNCIFVIFGDRARFT